MQKSIRDRIIRRLCKSKRIRDCIQGYTEVMPDGTLKHHGRPVPWADATPEKALQRVLNDPTLIVFSIVMVIWCALSFLFVPAAIAEGSASTLKILQTAGYLLAVPAVICFALFRYMRIGLMQVPVAASNIRFGSTNTGMPEEIDPNTAYYTSRLGKPDRVSESVLFVSVAGAMLVTCQCNTWCELAVLCLQTFVLCFLLRVLISPLEYYPVEHASIPKQDVTNTK